MAEISPDFGLLSQGDTNAMVDAIRLIWFKLLGAVSQSTTNYTLTTSMLNGSILSAAPAANQNNYNPFQSMVLQFTGSTNFDLTGIASGTTGRVLFVLSTGTGVVTAKHQSASSIVANRLFLAGGADKAINQYKAIPFVYTGTIWQELSWA